MNELEQLANALALSQNNAIANVNNSPTRSLNETTNQLFGSNFQQGEALANQRAALLSGQDPVSQGLKEQFKLQNEAAKQDAQVVRERIKAEKEALEFSIKQEDRQRKNQSADLKDQLTRARINKANRVTAPKAAKNGGVDAKVVGAFRKRVNSQIGKFQGDAADFATVQDAIDTGKVANFKRTLGTFAAVVSGDKRLSDEDAKRILNENLGNQFKGFIDRVFSGEDAKLAPAQQENLSLLVSQARTRKLAEAQGFIDNSFDSLSDTAEFEGVAGFTGSDAFGKFRDRLKGRVNKSFGFTEPATVTPVSDGFDDVANEVEFQAAPAAQPAPRQPAAPEAVDINSQATQDLLGF